MQWVNIELLDGFRSNEHTLEMSHKRMQFWRGLCQIQPISLSNHKLPNKQPKIEHIDLSKRLKMAPLQLSSEVFPTKTLYYFSLSLFSSF